MKRLQTQTVTEIALVCSVFVVVILLGTGLGIATGTDGTFDTGENEKELSKQYSEPPFLDSTVSEDTAVIETEHFEIVYYNGYKSEAESIATYADEYYETLFQKFGVMPSSEREQIVVGDMEELPCDGDGMSDGCFRIPPGTVYVSDDRPELVYHEIIHLYQYRSGVISPGGTSPLEVSVEGTARYLESPDEQIASGARFSIDEDYYFTNRDASGGEYDDLALFSEYILHEYDREGFDVLYTQSWVWPGGGGFGDAMEEATGEEYETIRDGFKDQLRSQENRMSNAETVLPAFTYEPFVITPGDEVTFDATTPSVIEKLDREWYPSEPTDYEWDLTGNGEIDETGAVVTTEEPADEVTLFVTVDGETHEVTQELLVGEAEFSIDEQSLETDEVQVDENAVVTATVSNTGDAPGEKQLAIADSETTLTNETMELEPDEEETVELSVPMTESGTYSLSLNEESVGELSVIEPASLSVTERSAADTEIEMGESTMVEVEVENTGDEEGEKTLIVEADGEELGTETVATAGSETITESIDVALEEEGAYELAVNGEPVTELRVIDPDALAVVDTDFSTTSVSPNETLHVEATVENQGDFEVEEEIELLDGDSVLAQQSVTLEPGESLSVEFEHEFDHSVEIDGESEITVEGETGELIMIEAIPDDESADEDSRDDNESADEDSRDHNELVDVDNFGNGFDTVLAIIALGIVSAGYYFRRL